MATLLVVTSRIARLWGVCLIALFVPLAAEAACGGSGLARAAASASRTDVNDCVTAAVSGATITVPAGSATWSSQIDLPSNKDLAVIGAGIGNTVLTCSSGVCFQFHLAVSHRVSGFTMSGPGGMVTSTNNNNQNPAKFFRIDHNRLVSTSGWEAITIAGATNGVHAQGLVDNNQIVDISVKTNGTNFGMDEGNYQNILWSQASPLGTGSQIVYIEDNVFTGGPTNVNFIDGNYGGRYIFRFNTASGKGYLEFHSVQGDNRAVQHFEVYKNTFTTAPGWPGMAFIRGGTGVVWGNRLPGTHDMGVVMDNVRSEGDPGGGVGRCDGSSPWDQNLPGQSGYACRDQIGRARDTVLWNNSPPGAYTQVLQPLYMWDNLMGTTPFAIDDSGLSTWLQQNRDWYTSNAAFNGTTGVGQGSVAARPATCTTGVAYWATDEGEWNSRQPGPDGQLYRCTAPNTWTLSYVPHTYPHPLQGTASPPPAPTNLQVTP